MAHGIDYAFCVYASSLLGPIDSPMVRRRLLLLLLAHAKTHTCAYVRACTRARVKGGQARRRRHAGTAAILLCTRVRPHFHLLLLHRAPVCPTNIAQSCDFTSDFPPCYYDFYSAYERDSTKQPTSPVED